MKVALERHGGLNLWRHPSGDVIPEGRGCRQMEGSDRDINFRVTSACLLYVRQMLVNPSADLEALI